MIQSAGAGQMMHRINRGAVAFLTLQGLGCLVWWGVLCLRPEVRQWFTATNAPDTTLMAFAAPDLLLFAAGSLAAAWGLATQAVWAWPVLCAHAGAVAYAGLYCVNLWLLSQSAWAGAALMTPSLVIVPVITWLLRQKVSTETQPLKFSELSVFREARPAEGAWNLLKSGSQMIVFWMLFLVVFPALIVTLEPVVGLDAWRFAWPGGRMAGGVIFVAGSCLGVSSCLVMALIGRGTPLPLDCARRMVVVGPYRYIRNPMAVAGIGQGIAVGLYLESAAVVLYALMGGPLWHVLVRPSEERDLQARFGASYEDYRQAVYCWIPLIRGYRPEPSIVAEQVPVDPDAPTAEGQQV